MPISGGLLYVGGQLAAERGYEVEPALIDPRLPVDLAHPDLAGDSMTYWPSYSKISPGARAAYLHWLRNGRSAPDACIGYVFLYLYGLERRLLVDQDDLERGALVAEVRRLLAIYRTNGSFRRYAEDLLGFVAVQDGRPAPAQPPERVHWLPDLPIDLRVGLAEFAADGTPIPANWALAWIVHEPDFQLRTPATRCAKQFATLFAHHYRERYGDGMVLTPKGPLLSVEYVAASPGIRSPRRATHPRLHGLGGQGRAISALREVAELATTELDAYSRYLGRHPDGAGDSAALALLPNSLPITEPSDAVRDLWTWANGELGESASVLTSTRTAKLSKPELVVIAQLLDRIGVGIEPDPRFGGAPPSPGKPVVLFRRAEQTVHAPNPDYAAAIATVNLGMLVASADGTVAESELAVLRDRAIAPWDLTEDERLRLDAHAVLVVETPPTPALLRRRLSLLPDRARAGAGAVLITIAAADGEITADEVRSLERLFGDLDLDPSQIYSTLHAAAASTEVSQHVDDAPVFALDPAVLAAKRAESARAAAQLAEIFAEDEPDVPPVEPEPTDVPGLVAGLDGNHSRLFALLAQQESWARAEVDGLAAELGLLTDGALEILNEAAFEHVGGPLTEGTDPIIVDTEIAEDMHV